MKKLKFPCESLQVCLINFSQDVSCFWCKMKKKIHFCEKFSHIISLQLLHPLEHIIVMMASSMQPDVENFSNSDVTIPSLR